MKVYAFPHDTYGVGHYRVAWPAAAAVAEGVDVVVVPPGEQGAAIGGDRLVSGGLVDAWCPDDADVIVLQRVTNRLVADAVGILVRKGVRVIVDVDDDLTCLHAKHPARFALHPKRDPDNNWLHLGRACAAASLVTCSTPALADRFGKHGRVQVLRNCVPESFLEAERRDEGTREPHVGWAGSTHSHPGDLDVMGAAVLSFGLPFYVVGPADGVGRALRLAEVYASGNVDFDQWPWWVATLDVGVAPLADTGFNRAKSWLKPLEYAACGVPWVATDLPEYRALTETVPGAVVARPREWTRELHRLRDPVLRAELSEAGRHAVLQHHTYQGNAWRWCEAWTSRSLVAG